MVFMRIVIVRGGFDVGEDNLKISCVLVGDAALDFEKCQVTLKIPARAPGKQRQQSLAISAAMLVLDATIQRYQAEKGERYPAIDQLLEYAGCRPADINKLLGITESATS